VPNALKLVRTRAGVGQIAVMAERPVWVVAITG
jgi:hypothetical protein